MISPKNISLLRATLVYICIIVFSVAVVLKICVLKFRDRAEYEELSKRVEYRTMVVEGVRGNIMTENGSLLATSVPRFEVRFDAMAMHDTIFSNDVVALSKALSGMFPSKSAERWARDLRKARKDGNRYYKLASNVSLEDYKKMEKFPLFKRGRFIGGLIGERQSRRENPYGELARRTIGYVREDVNVGLESGYNEYLKAENGVIVKRRINNGGWMPVNSSENKDSKNGKDIVTTIDINLQDVAENALKQALTENIAYQGCAVLMEVQTGYIKAIANLRYNKDKDVFEESYNFAFAERIEPGSTFKLASMMAVLDADDRIKLTDTISIGTGAMVFANKSMEDDHVVRKSGRITVREVFEQSSNKGTAYLVTKTFGDNPSRYVDKLYSMGLNKPLEIGITGEAMPYIKHPKKDKNSWSKTSLPWMSIGYELQLAPIQILALYNAVANNGVMMKPQIVKEVRDGNVVVKSFDPIVVNNKIASEETISELRSMMEGVVDLGTAKLLNQSKFKIAGKTGTAQIYNTEHKAYKWYNPKTGKMERDYNTTFVGYFPADNPKYSCIVVVSKAKGRYWGAGRVAAPVFKEIADRIYATHIGIDYGDSLAVVKPSNLLASQVGSSDRLLSYCDKLGWSYHDESLGGSWITADIATSGDDALVMRQVSFDDDVVPNVKGMGLSDAVFLLESMGCHVKVDGRGRVISQSVQPGTALKAGCTINLTLKN